MTARVAGLWRHPIKSHGREALDAVTLTAGQAMPWDRRWAVAHEASKAVGDEWVPCANFSRGSKAPGLMAISATLDEDAARVTLTHPDLDPLEFSPDEDGEALIDWVAPIVPQGRAAPDRVLSLSERGFTDTPFASISIASFSSHAAIETAHGAPLDPRRWRMNLWIEGLPAWEEFDWIDRDLRIGEATLKVRERTTRCLATTANPDTGQRDEDTLATLKSLGHQDFGVYAEVSLGGRVALNDTVSLL